MKIKENLNFKFVELRKSGVGGVISLNYFMEMNPDYKESGFDYSKAKKIDGKSQCLIENLRIFVSEQFNTYNIAYETLEVEKLYDVYGLSVDKLRLTCDYLGPSIYYAAQQFSNEDVLQFIVDTRIFGGHIVWPSLLVGIGRFDDKGIEITKSINTARSYCLRERLDYTLYEIREWYINGGNMENPIFQAVLEGNRCWLEKFGCGEDGYKKFINVFVLNDMVTPDTFEPYDFESFNGKDCNKVIKKRKRYADDYIPKDKKSYKNYILATISVLNKRDGRIKSNAIFHNF